MKFRYLEIDLTSYENISKTKICIRDKKKRDEFANLQLAY